VQASIRVELVVFNRLQSNDSGDAENVVRVRAAGDICGGPIQSQQNLSVRMSARDVLKQFAGNISRIEVRKDQNIRSPRDFAFRQFSKSNLRNEGRVHLQFTVELGIHEFLVRLLLGQSRGGLNLADRRMRGAAFGREGKQRDMRTGAEQLLLILPGTL